MAKNPLGKSRSADSPYAVFENPMANWKWKVLKTYQLAKNEKQYARWFLATSSPYVTDELGDGCCAEILDDPQAVCTYASPEFIEAYRDDPRVRMSA
jgi:hypothetical protein|tara:strand:- start:465 stop:755 length:291 start_codon:yes stop_codon:yes gene_type:complete